jgi:hypothetical protein
MNIRNFDREHTRSFQTRRPLRRSSVSQPNPGRSIVSAVLAVVCVVGVFGLLGLLYSYGM